jgi:DNA-binding PadR family transcriptional regulator
MPSRRKALTPAAQHIVLALLEGELHGYALMRHVEELSDGTVRMGPGTLYGTLNRLVVDGLIVETTDRVHRSDGERRRFYELTPTGRAVALEEVARLQALIERVARRSRGPATA